MLKGDVVYYSGAIERITMKDERKGVIKYQNEIKYEGEIQNHMPHGRGVMSFSSGDVYQG